MIEAIRSAGAVSYRQFGTARELERLLRPTTLLFC